MIYEIEVVEILKKKVEVESASEAEALCRVEEMYIDEDIVLDSSDYSNTHYEVSDDKESLGRRIVIHRTEKMFIQCRKTVNVRM